MTHPMALLSEAKGTNRNGQVIEMGTKVRCMSTGRFGVVDEILQDGDAYVTWQDGSFGEPKWYNLEVV